MATKLYYKVRRLLRQQLRPLPRQLALVRGAVRFEVVGLDHPHQGHPPQANYLEALQKVNIQLISPAGPKVLIIVSCSAIGGGAEPWSSNNGNVFKC